MAFCPGYTQDYLGVLAGYEQDLGSNRVGFVGGIASGELVTDEAGFDMTSQSVFAGLYLNRLSGTANLTGSLIAGVERYDNERQVIDNLAGEETATATIDNSFVSAAMEATGQPIMLGATALHPSAAVTYTASFFEGYTETGTTNANLQVDDRTAQTLTGRWQLATHYVIGAVDTEFRGGIDGRLSFEDDITISLNDSSIDITPTDSDRFANGFMGIRATFAQSGNLRLMGDVEYQFGQNEEEAVAAGLNISFSF